MPSLIRFARLLPVIVLSALSLPLCAQSPPPALNYQGILKDAEGNALVGLKTLQFRVHDAKTGGNILWGPQSLEAPLIDGRFNVILTKEDVAAGGDDVTLAFAGSGSASRFFSVTINGTEQGERQEILGVPWAHNSVRSLSADQAVVAAAVLPGSVVDASILDGSLTGKEFADKSVGLEKLGVGESRSSPISFTGVRWSPNLANQDVSIPGLSITGLPLSGKGRPVLVALRRTPGFRATQGDIIVYHYQDEVTGEIAAFFTVGPSSNRTQVTQSMGFYSGASAGPDIQTIPVSSVSFIILPPEGTTALDVRLAVRSPSPSRIFFYPGTEVFAYEL